jgi:hypothetical protein
MFHEHYSTSGYEMKRELVAKTKLEFETNRETWKAFGVDLVVGTPCAQSPMARKAMHGHWQQALQDYFKIADFSDHSEETMVGFILATEVTFHRRSPASIPELPERVWDEKSFKKSLWWFEDGTSWHRWVGNKYVTGEGEYFVNRNTFRQLLLDDKPTEAEAYFFEHGMNRLSCAETDLAAARMCSYIHGTKAEGKRAASTTMWFYADSAKRSRGPISELEMRKAFDGGKLLRSTFVWTEGMTCWQQAAHIACFQNAAYSGKLPPPLE